jgi:acyl-CoA thioesterase-1
MYKFFLTVLLLFFSITVFAQSNILVLGDSIGAGFGFDPKFSWVSLLQQRLTQNNYPFTVINLSVSGSTTSNGLAQLPDALKKYTPTITIIELGANDGLRGNPPNLIKQNLEKLIALAIAAHSKVLVLGLRLPATYGDAYNKAFMNIYSELALRQDIKVVPLFLNTIDENPDLMQADHLHPAIKAQSIILDNVWPTLETFIKPL